MPDSFCRFAARWATIFAIVVAFAPTNATASAFTVKDVPVDVTAGTASQAREQALADGETRAFSILLRRLTESADHARLPQLSPTEVTALVRDFSLRDEKISDVRYLARMTVRFRSAEVRDLLLAYGIPFAETESKPVMVVPILDAGRGPELWTDTNPWRFAWADWLADAESGGLVPFVLPLGDLADIAALDVESARRGEVRRLQALALRYGAEQALIAQARWLPNTDGTGFLDVSSTRIGTDFIAPTIASRFVKAAEEEDSAFLRRAAAAVDALVQDDWIASNRIAFDQRGIMAVAVPIGALGDWLEIKRRLDTVPVIEDLEIVLLNRAEVRVNMHFIGSPEQLARALKQNDLLLYENDGQWFVYPENT